MIVKENLTLAQQRQKHWYDQNARDRELNPGEQVLILLPTSTNKLLAQWQGPYKVVKKIGKVNYLVNLHDRRKKNRVYHINMLRKCGVNQQPQCAWPRRWRRVQMVMTTSQPGGSVALVENPILENS